MDKRVLMVSTVPSTIGQFNMNNIRILQDMGFTVDVACDFHDTSVWPTERTEKYKEQMKALNIECIQLDFSRNPLRVKRHMDSYHEILKLIKNRQYSFIHTHTPIASAIIRIAAKKTGTKVIYTAHGFHFYKGAPVKNWIIYYPIEKYLSQYTDILITITKEDYQRATKHFKAKRTEYVPGVGVDTTRFSADQNGRKRIREELGIKEKQTMILSVGELNENKNHEKFIRALSGMDQTYVVVGKGELEERLKTTAQECTVDLRLTGFRTDVADFYRAADIYALPSIREGLNVSLMEAMATGLPCVCGRIRGNVDLIDEKGGRMFDPRSSEEMKEAIQQIMAADRIAVGEYNRHKIRKFSTEMVNDQMRILYEAMA